MTLSAAQRELYTRTGHLTVPGVFTAAEIDAAVADILQWGEEFLGHLTPAERRWYVDGGVKAQNVLRKLDNPVFHRPAVRALASNRKLVELVEAIIGPGVCVTFSQIFFKPPHGGGPKPVHQDNYYFGPRDPERIITAWVALDDATPENGCLQFADGTNLGPVYPHVAPPGEPFNLQLTEDVARRFAMTHAPVPKGGVSFHHGNTLHQSGDNHSAHWRRAAAIHYLANDNHFATPGLPYDKGVILRIS